MHSCVGIHADQAGRRHKRQIKIPDLTGINQGCATTGYETREREVCEEVTEKVCTPTTGVKYRKEIYTRCDTRIRQDCNTTMREVPNEVCKERNTTQCFQDFKIVEDTRFTSECENIVQHVCEEHYHVPVSKPVVFPVPIFLRKKRNALEKFSQRSKRQVPVRDAELLLRQLKSAIKVPPPPLITHKELPAPPGCRSLVTQKCHKIPEKFNRRIPEEVCREVPGVECHLELEEVEEPKCYNVPVEECDDILKEIPYLVEEEECEDVEKLECVQIEEQVPIQVCTSIDVNRDVLITNFKGEEDEEDEDEDEESKRLTLKKKPAVVDSLKKILQPRDLDLIRKKIFGNKAHFLSKIEKPQKSDKEIIKGEKKLPSQVVDMQEFEKLKSRALRGDIRTILEPGQLDQLKETGRWSVTRVKKSEGTDDTSSKVNQLLRRLLS